MIYADLGLFADVLHQLVALWPAATASATTRRLRLVDRGRRDQDGRQPPHRRRLSRTSSTSAVIAAIASSVRPRNSSRIAAICRAFTTVC
jgi:hypothetical protein